jgi:hypothetical protein
VLRGIHKALSLYDLESEDPEVFDWNELPPG